MNKGGSLHQYLEKNAEVELAALILCLSEGCKVIANAVRNAGLLNLTGSLESTNVQGETVQKLDDFSNRVLMDYCQSTESCAGYLSEENEGIVTLHKNGRFVISVDPLDGSSNIDVAAPIGTIFSIHERISDCPNEVSEADFLQSGKSTKAAGFVLYGSSTLLVLSTGNGTVVFTLDTQSAEFKISNSALTIPADGKIYSINQGNIQKFEAAAEAFVSYCMQADETSNRPYSLRYIGSMVGDLYRTLLKGGVFLYPASKKDGKGKLRLLYECIPMTYLVEQAGGEATDGKNKISDLIPSEIHERSAIVIGSKNLVHKYTTFTM